jgi:hypothetical protein
MRQTSVLRQNILARFNRFYFHLVFRQVEMVWKLFVNGLNDCEKSTTYYGLLDEFSPIHSVQKK